MSEENKKEKTPIDILKDKARALEAAGTFAMREPAKAFSDQLITIIEDQEKRITWLGKQVGQGVS